uniref:Type I cytokine receptor cytokine-binding domain-containing protein n=1 Tax=Athene cunicularia TaxID=194338 RepID=A0A663M326_ATHCN
IKSFLTEAIISCNCRCLTHLSMHKVLQFGAVTRFFLIMDIPVFAGMNGSAIENFSCVIYNISLMKCTWQAGRDAPGDTQYFLYWQNSRDNDVMECELYIKDENGRNTGCRFQNVMIKTEGAYFLVNGSSKDSLIQFFDEYIELYKIALISASHCQWGWHMPTLYPQLMKLICVQNTPGFHMLFRMWCSTWKNPV